MSTILKQVLIDKGISQNNLSHLAKIPASNINLIVNGKQYPGPSWRQRISEVLDIPEDTLFPEEVKSNG